MPADPYLLYVPKARMAFGSTKWDHNLIDAASYGAENDGERVITSFSLQQITAWFDDGAADPRGNVRKAFYETLRRHIPGSFLVPIAYDGRPDPELKDAKSVYSAARVDEWLFRFELKIPAAHTIEKPRGYLDNGWARVVSKCGKGILNLLLARDDPARPVALRELVSHCVRHRYMDSQKASKGIANLGSLGLLTVTGGNATLARDRFDEAAPKPGLPGADVRKIYEVLPGRDAVLASQLEEALSRLGVLDNYLLWIPGLKKAFQDIQRWRREPDYSLLLQACDVAANLPQYDRKWERAIAQASARKQRFRAAASRFSKRLPTNTRVSVPTVPLDFRTVSFKAAWALVVTEDLPSETVGVDISVYDGHGGNIASGRYTVQPGYAPGRVLGRLDLTKGIRRYADEMLDGEEPVLEFDVRTQPRGHDFSLRVIIGLDNASPR